MRGRIWNSWTMFDNADGSGNITTEETHARPAGEAGPQITPEHLQVAHPAPRSASDTSPAAIEHSFQRTMAETLERAMDLSEVRMERVARIRDAIAAGHYNVPSERVARRLLETMLGDLR